MLMNILKHRRDEYEILDVGFVISHRDKYIIRITTKRIYSFREGFITIAMPITLLMPREQYHSCLFCIDDK